MKKFILPAFFFISLSLFAQPDTEVYLADITSTTGEGIQLSNPRNISNNQGYDNQPYFYDNNSVVFASTREGQTDILKFNVLEGSTSTWLTDTPTGSEYSPLRIPESNAISAIRLDMDGLQRLYEYNFENDSSKVIVKDAKIGYHLWYTPDMLVATVLTENRMDLIISNLEDERPYKTTQKNVGRSLQNIPNTDLVSYISKENPKNWELKSLNPATGAKETIIDLGKTEDICWLPDGTLLTGKDKGLYKYNPKTDEDWVLLQSFTNKNINNITRLAVNEGGTRLAFVAEPSPESIVQKQVDSYNAGDLDAFVNCYDQNVVVRNFPKHVRYEGREKMRENYSSLSPEKKVYDVEVIKRMTLGNKVIDEEKVTGNGKIQMQVALYEINSGKISSMDFIFDDSTVLNPESIVQEQMNAYNARDIDSFLQTYTEDVEVYNFPNETSYTGKENMKKRYASFFESTPDLNYIVKNRMVIANYVIDEEYITANGKNFSAIAIYEVENGKIAKVTFIQ